MKKAIITALYLDESKVDIHTTGITGKLAVDFKLECEQVLKTDTEERILNDIFEGVIQVESLNTNLFKKCKEIQKLL